MGKGWNRIILKALWAYWKAFKTLIGLTLYQLIYGDTCHIPAELEFKSHGAIKRWKMDLQGLKGKKFNWLNWMNGGIRPPPAPSSTRSGWKDDKISRSRSSISKWEMRYYSLIPGFVCLVMVSLEVSGKGLVQWSLQDEDGNIFNHWKCSSSPNYQNSKK